MNFYFEAAKVLDRLDAKQGSIKGVIATVPEKDRKRTAALVIETLKYKDVLGEVMKATDIMKQERKITSRNLGLVLVHDLLLAGGIQASEGVIKQAVLRHKSRLHSELQRIKIKRGVKSTGDLARSGDERAARIPRYIRVNTIRWTAEDAIAAFVGRGFKLSDPFSDSKGFARDEHLPDLLLFPPDAQFADDPWYHDGKVILQDKASCFPPFILAPPAEEGSVVIDATAAPGNKTSYLSALMKGKGKLYAFERDKKRFKTLQTMLARARCTNAVPVNADFLNISPEDEQYNKVTHILLDPSCSGSGIVNRLDHLLESESENDDEKAERLIKLAAFQLLMIRHAMKFPNVRRIAYSTCSIHATENEHVVRQALQTEECRTGQFVLASRGDVLPSWPRRGLPEEMDNPDDAASLIRCSPGEDATNGFFVSLFVRQADVAAQSPPEADPGKKRSADGDEDLAPPAKRHKKKKKKKAKSKATDLVGQPTP